MRSIVIAIASRAALFRTSKTGVTLVPQLALLLSELTVPDLDAELDSDREGALLEFA